LERAANTALSLVQDLHTSSEQVSNLSSAQKATDLPSLKMPLDHDTERAQFVMKLAPRIRKLESDTSQCLSLRLEASLKQIQRQCDEGTYINDDQDAGSKLNQHEVSKQSLELIKELGYRNTIDRNTQRLFSSLATFNYRALH